MARLADLIKRRYLRLKFNITRLLGYLWFLVKQSPAVFEIVLLFVLVYFSPYSLPLIPALTDTFASSLDLIAGVLAAILGITVAIMLISFEFMRRYYPSYSLKAFLNNFNLRELFHLFLGTLLLSGFVSTYEKNLNDIQQKNLMWLVFYLYAVAIIFLFTYLKKIILASNLNKSVPDLIAGITYDHIYRERYTHESKSEVDQAEEVEGNPLYVLAESANVALKDGKRIYPQLVLIGVTKRLKEEIEKTHDKRDAIKGFLFVYQNIAAGALRLKDSKIVGEVLDNLEDIEATMAVNKAKWSELLELDDAIKDLLKASVRRGLEGVVQDGYYSLSRIMKYHLEHNCPEESKIWILDIHNKAIKHDSDIDLQWEHISMDYLRAIRSVAEEAIVRKLPSDLVYSAAHIYDFILNTALDIQSLGTKQKSRIVGWALFEAQSLSVEFAKTTKQRWQLFPLEIHKLGELSKADANEPIVQKLIEHYGNTLIEFLRLGVLNVFELNQLGAEGRGLSREVGNSILNDKSLMFVTDVFSRVKLVCEENINQTYYQEMYLDCYSQVSSFLKWGKPNIRKHKKIYLRIQRLLKSFKNLPRYKKALGKYILKWEDSTV
jgi:hypothetical protein